MDKDFELECTNDAEKFARLDENSIMSVKMNLWDNMSTYRLSEWRKQLDDLVLSTGISLEEAAIYAGLNSTGYYRRIPKAKESFIAIGMAFGRDLATINEWIVRFGQKRKLYIKDVLSDMVWIYLIQVNHRQFEKKGAARENYLKKYDEIALEMEKIYREKQEVNAVYGQTETIENMLLEAVIAENDDSLRIFLDSNMSHLRSAYLKPRKMIADYISLIIDTVNENSLFKRKWTKESLRGYLSDSQMNYISGDFSSSSALDKQGNKTVAIKKVPQGKKSHISLGLALGMTLDDLNEYLKLMGYSSLDAVSYEEAQLINLLVKWEKSHPLQRRLKQGEKLKPREAVKAAFEMLELSEDIKKEYESQQIDISKGGKVRKSQIKFPYSKE